MRNIIPKEELLIQELRPKTQEIREVESRLQKNNRLGINIGLLEGAFLGFLVAQKSVEKVVEIGSQYGCSSVYMAQAIGNKGEIYLLENNEECLKELHQTFFVEEKCKYPPQIHIMPGLAMDTLRQIEKDGPFDLIFIDADKGGYLEYYQWAGLNLKKGGYLVADNVFLFDGIFEEEAPKGISKKSFNAMKSFMSQFFGNPNFQTSLIPTQEGMAVGLKLT